MLLFYEPPVAAILHLILCFTLAILNWVVSHGSLRHFMTCENMARSIPMSPSVSHWACRGIHRLGRLPISPPRFGGVAQSHEGRVSQACVFKIFQVSSISCEDLQAGLPGLWFSRRLWPPSSSWQCLGAAAGKEIGACDLCSPTVGVDRSKLFAIYSRALCLILYICIILRCLLLLLLLMLLLSYFLNMYVLFSVSVYFNYYPWSTPLVVKAFIFTL